MRRQHPSLPCALPAVTLRPPSLWGDTQVCDLLCQAKLIAANPSNTWGCTIGAYCQVLVNSWTDIIVTVLNSLTNNNNVVRTVGLLGRGSARHYRPTGPPPACLSQQIRCGQRL